MSERGIIMAADSVRAILAGRKTQTRRAYRPRNPEPWELPPGEGYRDDGTPWPMYQDAYGDFHPVRCPYGAPGDKLFVKEAWSIVANEVLPVGRRRSKICYEGTGDVSEWIEHAAPTAFPGGGRPSQRRSPMFMPRWASRLTLEVVEVRVQRVQEISEQDARAEGCPGADHGRRTDRPRGELAVAEYAAAWDRINAKRGFPWASNPFVWAVTFKRVEAA